MVMALTPTPTSQLLTTTHLTSPPSSPNNQPRHLLHFIKNCTTMPQLKQIHAQTLKTTSPHHYNTVFIYSRLVHFTASADLGYASRLLDHIENPNSFIWNTVIRAYAWSVDQKHESLVLYDRMLNDGCVAPDKYTFPFVLKACAYLFAVSEGRQMHAHILKLGFGCDTHVNNSLVHLYSTCGCLEVARRVFDRMSQRSVVSWNVVIDGFVQCGEYGDGLRLFGEMQSSFAPDGFTMQSVVAACGGLGALSLGMWAHVYVLRKCGEGVGNDVLMNNSLLGMYWKCGSLDIALQLFEAMPERDVTSWNSIILGLAMHGRIEDSLDAFARMCLAERLKPTSLSFIGVLSACNHGGLVSEGSRYFNLMVGENKIQPQIEHYGCMVDLLARAGLISEALNLVSSMPMKPDAVIWRSLLDACCKKNASIELSESVAKQILESEEVVTSGVYVLLSRVYASANRWNDVGLVRTLMSKKGIRKEPGCSSIEIDGAVHQFLAGDTTHPRSNEIYETLKVIEERLESRGYVPNLSQAPMVADFYNSKQESLRLHSERLAIAYGLLNAKPGAPIRILKNLRVCRDCHTATKLISSIFGVEIIVRDRVRFHRFKDGLCSCSDYW